MIRARASHRRGYTLIELLITIAIIALMASMVLFALYSAQEAAKVAKTKSLIAKLDAVIKAKWEAYRTRRVPIVIPAGTVPKVAAQTRLLALHDLMRMELPDRWTDICNVTPSGGKTICTTTGSGLSGGLSFSGIPPSSIWNSYLSRVTTAVNAGNPPDLVNQNAECLYLIVTTGLQEDADGKEVFKADDIGDTDGDGAPEFVDAWKQPIRFLRWAPGFQLSELQIVANNLTAATSMQTVTVTGTSLNTASGSYVGGAIATTGGGSALELDPKQMSKIVGYSAGTITIPSSPSVQINSPAAVLPADPFDPLGSYTFSPTGPPPLVPSVPSFALYPLIYSAGPDKCFGIVSDSTPPLVYPSPPVNLNPFTYFASLNVPSPFLSNEMIGTARDITGEPNFVTHGWLDNIHNHMIGTR